MLRLKSRPNFAMLIVHVAIDDLEVAVHRSVEYIEIIVSRFEPVMIEPAVFISISKTTSVESSNCNPSLRKRENIKRLCKFKKTNE